MFFKYYSYNNRTLICNGCVFFSNFAGSDFASY